MSCENCICDTKIGKISRYTPQTIYVTFCDTSVDPFPLESHV